MMDEEKVLFHAIGARVIQTHSMAQFLFDTEYMLPYVFDEVSILFRYPGTMRRWVDWAKELGADHFNAHVVDRMIRTDLEVRPPRKFPERFDVQFEFLRLTKASAWRIEAMHRLKGPAPLHEAMLGPRNGPDACVFHVSFKLPTAQEYRKACARLAQSAFVQAASYRNSYGFFSYWQGLNNVYVKPRVNTRD
jgi:hypothetical protein